MKVAVSGASGLIGRALTGALRARGDQPIVLGRRSGDLAWDPNAGPPPSAALEGADAFVHLAGEPVAERGWSESRKRRVRDSRVLGTRHAVEGLRAAANRPPTFLCASAVGYYGDRGDEPLDERSPPGHDFLARVCVEWEAEAHRAADLGVRVVNLRSGIVLARDGGALPLMARPFRFFVGGPLASGRHWMPWIHLSDEVGLILHALDGQAVQGPINLVAPSPVRNRVFAHTLGRVLGRPALFPVPRPVLRLVLGERVDVLLASQRVGPAAAQAAGYRFRFPELEPALGNLFDG
ncbi:MAG TPA: TIGR01777 family oxidoreductase [Chloroflexota bacterium]